MGSFENLPSCEKHENLIQIKSQEIPDSGPFDKTFYWRSMIRALGASQLCHSSLRFSLLKTHKSPWLVLFMENSSKRNDLKQYEGKEALLDDPS